MRWSLLQPYYPPLQTTHGPSRRLPLLVLALEGATSYGASAVANPPGHMSRRGASSTGNGTVAPGGSARLASLRTQPSARQRYKEMATSSTRDVLRFSARCHIGVKRLLQGEREGRVA